MYLRHRLCKQNDYLERSLPLMSAHEVTEPFPFSRNSTAAIRLSVNCRGRNSHCCNRQPAHYQKVSKALLQPLPPQIVSQTYLVISLFFPSSIHSSGLCYVVSPDTPFLSRGSWLLLMLLRKSLPLRAIAAGPVSSVGFLHLFHDYCKGCTCACSFSKGN